ncbi:MAG: PAS domain S-box protein [Rhizobiales bacterium]|nr:PAS domain S-box protein [Hyphomicrobiales bacterium]
MKHDSAIESPGVNADITGFAIFDENDRLLEANEALLDLGEAELAKLVGKTPQSVLKIFLNRLVVIDGEPAKRSRAFLKSFIERWSSFGSAPIEAQTNKGNWKLLTSHPRPGGGKALICVNMTKFKQAQLTLHENEEIFRCITESHPLPVWMADEETGEILYESIEASKLLGRDWDEHTPQFIAGHYVDPKAREEVRALLDEHGILKDHLVRFQKADGTKFWISANVRRGMFRGRKALISGIVDVTARKEREDQLRLMLEAHPLPVSVNEVETGRVIVESPASAQLFGREYESKSDAFTADHYVNPEDRKQLLKRLRKDRFVDGYEAMWRRTDGSQFWARVNLRLLELDGRDVILSGVVDVTEQKQREDELSRARELLADAIESISEGFALYDEDARLVVCNSTYMEMNKVAADILKPGVRWEQVLRVSAVRGEYPQAVGREEEWLAERQQNRAEFSSNHEFQHQDGRWYSVSLHETRLGGFVVTRTDITERMQNEAARREGEEIVRQVVDACPAALEMRSVASGDFLYRSPAAVELLGARNDLVATYVDPQDQLDLHKQLRTEREVFDRRMQLINAEGKPFWASVSARYIEFRGDLVIVSTISDLTERVEIEQGFKRASELLTDAIESLAEGFALFGADNKLIMCNARYKQMNHLISDLLKPGLEWNEFLEAGAWRGQYKDAIGREEDWINDRKNRVQRHDEAYEYQQADGRWYSGLSSPTREGGFVLTRVDVTRRKEMEAAQREADHLVQQVLEACPVMIMMNELENGDVIYSSPATRSLFGEPDSVRSFYADIKDRERYLEQMKANGFVDDFVYQAKGPDGNLFWAAVSGRLMEYQGRQVIVSHTQDLTDRLTIEAELERQRDIVHQSEKLSALGELLAGVAHELNNPLSVVVGQAMLLKETANDNDVVVRADKIGSAADRCARIVKTFLAMARQQPHRTENININDVFESALEVAGYAARASDIDVSLRLASNLPAIWGDPDQLGQVFSNLLINAQQALSDSDGRRKIKIVTRYDRKQNSVIVKVADTGPGIPENIRSRIFEPFFTTKEIGTGTGIGLAFCHRIIETHGGAIRVESRPGQGTSFFIRLPASSTPDTCAPAGVHEQTGKGRLSILVIDDEPDVAELVSEVLNNDGHAVTCANNGTEALQLISKQPFDFILSDLNMPGLDGASLFDRLAVHHPELLDRMAFVTGDTMSPKARSFLDGAGRPYLEKPIRPAELRQLVAQLMVVD